MAETLPSNLSVGDLKIIIHGLKMAGFSFVDQQALTEINAMIKSLPGPEEIDKLTINHMETIKKITIDVGGILRLVEIYGQRDMEYKVRYKTRTGLPPRYKVMDWRKAMKQEAIDLVKELVRMSSVADGQGKFDIADKLVRCAKKIQDTSIQEPDFIDVIAGMERSGFNQEAKLIREAYSWDQFKGNVRGLGTGIGNVVNNIKTDIQVGGLTAKFNNFIAGVKEFKKQLGALVGKLGNNPTLQKKVDDLNKSIEVDNKYVEQMVADIEGNLQQAQGVKQPDVQQRGGQSQVPAQLRFNGQPFPLEQADGKFYITVDNQKREVSQQGGKWTFAPAQQTPVTPDKPVNKDPKAAEKNLSESPMSQGLALQPVPTKGFKDYIKQDGPVKYNDGKAWRSGVVKGVKGRIVVVEDSETKQPVSVISSENFIQPSNFIPPTTKQPVRIKSPAEKSLAPSSHPKSPVKL